MNTNGNSINTGMASKVDEFQWFKQTPNVHVEKVMTTAPDFSIPPTPSSSYSNLHVVLDTVHTSTETITRGVVAPEIAPCVYQQMPVQQVRSIPVSMPETSSASITTTTVKSAPIFDSLAERTDRSLPEVVDISLVDETSAWTGVRGQIQGKNWNLKSLKPKRSSQWNRLGSDIRNKKWNLRKLPSRDAKYRTQWTKVGTEIASKNWTLKHTQTRQMIKAQPWTWVEKLEGAERRWRMTRGIDAVWSGRVHNVGKELMSTVGPIGWSQWLSNLKNKIVSKVAALESKMEEKSAVVVEKAVEVEEKIAEKTVDLMDAAIDMAQDVTEALTPEHVEAKHIIWQGPQTWHFGTEHYTISLPRLMPSFISSLIETERSSRLSRGVNPVLSGKWHRIGRELKHNLGEDIAYIFAGLKNKLTRTSSDLISSAKDTIISMNTAKAPSSLSVPKGLSYNYDKIDFTFQSRRVPSYIIALEEAERAYRIQHGVNPIVLGKWHQINLELKYQYSIRPTLASTATHVVEVAAGVASGLVGKAEGILEEISEKVIESGKDLVAAATPAPEVNFIEQDHPLNLFAYDAEPIDFTFKSRRCPAWIIAEEEKERSARISDGVDIVAYGKWNSLLSESHKTLADSSSVSSYVPSLTSAKEALIESSKGFSGFFSSLAHNVADRIIDAEQKLVDATFHNQYVEAAKGYYDGTSTAAINKAEEAERLRRMNTKVDTMTAARLGRVQEELLHSVKSI